MNIIKKIITVALFLFFLSVTACSSSVDDKALKSTTGYSDVKGLKLEVGQPAPGFTLKNHIGKQLSLASYKSKKNVMLIFYRGHWCPFCIGQLDDIQSILPLLEKYNVQLLAISPEGDEGMQKVTERFDQSYIFLSDPELKATDSYGIRRDQELPHPAVVIINSEGIVEWFYVGENYRKRPTAAQLKLVLERLF